MRQTTTETTSNGAGEPPSPSPRRRTAWRFPAVIAGAALLVATLLTGGLVILLRADAVTLDGGAGLTEGARGQGKAPPGAVFAGLGAWVDVYDYAPAYQASGVEPAVTPADVAVMAAQGTDTLYLQTSAGSDDLLADAPLVRAFVEAAHEHGMDVVGWYAPLLTDVEEDVSKIGAALALETSSGGLDGFAVDIEVRAVDDVEERNRRLVALSERLDESTEDEFPVAAIVLPPVLLTEINPDLWPDYPWSALADRYDAWFPMAYWTVRSEASPYHDPERYVRTNVEQLRRLLDDDDAAIHALGGVGTDVTRDEATDFVTAVEGLEVTGASFYDYASTPAAAMSVLRDGLAGTRADEVRP
jgi:hypothetical protein